MEKLMSNTEYGKYLNTLNIPDYEYRYRRSKYDELLSQPLTLGMFIPCDLDGNVLEEPEWWYRYCNGATPFMNSDEIRPCQEYKKAKSRVLFEGFKQNIFNATGSFEIINEAGFQVCAYKALPQYFLWLGCPEERNIESLIKFNPNLILSETAKSQLS